MTTTTTFQGVEPNAKSSSRVLRPPGGASNISFGTDEEKPPARKNKMASSVFAEPEDPYANRRNNPPGGKPTGVLCGEPSAPLRRGANQGMNPSADMDGDTPVCDNGRDGAETEAERQDDAPPAEDPAAGLPSSGRRNPPGGKSSLILG
ncbi:jupiter microtubule associated homolog 1a [Nerophis lumbriciformis]|uniref:jupiter microtubule associated homolog 1a n=1 Tax=Nerophis lumbriciformis TaxID=546530 RepID=UPI002AE07079|nr:jupiter microtubule associated homolog 1-like [Nerophis lumbriciformis]XP_061882975.1 jupiter microtubule associated homolog 1a [Entelurus aequoreus]